LFGVEYRDKRLVQISAHYIAIFTKEHIMAEYRSSVTAGSLGVADLFRSPHDDTVWIVEQQRPFMDETVAEREDGTRRVWLSTFLVIPL
jgi:hypothetical protein